MSSSSPRVTLQAPAAHHGSSRSDSSSSTSSSGSRSSQGRHSHTHSPSLRTSAAAAASSPLWQAILPSSDSHVGQRCVMRGVWCVCSADDADNNGGGGGSDPPALSLGSRSATAVAADSPSDAAAARIVLLQTTEVAAIMVAQAAASSSSSASSSVAAFLPCACAPGVLLIPHRSSRCRFVLLHTSLSAAPGMQAELSSRLHYLRALHTQLQTANKGSLATEEEHNPADVLVPNCRMLLDGRLALVLPDELGTALCSGPPAPGVLSFAPLLRIMGMAAAKSLAQQTQEKLHASVRRPAIPQQVVPVPSSSLLSSSLTVDLAAVLGWLRMVGALLDALHDLHAHGLVHRALHPSTIAFNAAAGRVQFFDLGGSTRLTQTRADPQMRVDVTDLARFHFTSPEQTGKSLRVVDMRSDLYSLGALIFFLVTGRPPFQGSDAMEIMHAHLAKAPPTFKHEAMSSSGRLQQTNHKHEPETPSEGNVTLSAPSTSMSAAPSPSATTLSTPLARVRSALLTVLDAIVGKLLQKQAEDRYASVAGLSHDWNAIIEIVQRCSSSGSSDREADSATADPPAAALNAAAESLAGFRIGLLDVRSNFFVSQKLYGRAEQIQALLDSYQRVCGPRGGSSGGNATVLGPPVAPHLFLISGYSGVGKTSLVDALHKHIVRDHGLFARGKFDLLKRDSSCLLQAFRAMVQQMCAAADAIVWRVKIMKALGRNAAALIEVLPELAVLLGPQPPVPVLGASDTANRLNMTLMNFVGATATAATPMAIMIDDLQWADTGSLNTIKLLMSHERAHLLIIGAFRSNEVDAQHPLALLILELKSTCRSDADDAEQAEIGQQTNAPDSSVVLASACPRVCEVELSPLDVDSVEQLVSDSFQCEPQDARALAQVLMDKTLGNPFFCQTVLHSWHEAGLLTFNFASRRWEWQLAALARTTISSDVSDLVCRSMRSLSADCQMLLQYAACSGHEVTLGLLRTVIPASITHDEMMRAVLTLERRGMLICTAHADDLALLTMRAASAEMQGNTADTEPDPLGQSASGDLSSPSLRPSSPPPGLLLSRLSVITLQFAHDKIQLAALRLISPSDLPLVHCAIATQLLSAYDDAERDEFAVDIAGHVIDGVLACATDSRTDGVAAWCRFFAGAQMVPKVISVMLCAAAHAKKASAYDSGIKFIGAGISIVQHSQQLEAAGNTTLPPLFESSIDRSHVGTPKAGAEIEEQLHNGPTSASSSSAASSAHHTDGDFDRLSVPVWHHSYSSCFRLYTELCFCAFLAGRARSSQLCIEYTLEHVVAVAERGQLWELHVQTLMVQGLMQEAVDTSLSYLRELGVELETEMSPELERWVVGQPPFNGADESTFHHHAVFKLENNPAPLAMNLLSAFTAALFFLKSALFPRVVWTMLNLTMRHGVTPESAFAFALYSMTLWGTHSRYTENFSLGMVAKMLLDRFGEAGRSQAPRTNCAALGDIFPWRKPLRWCNQLIHGAFEEAFAQGDLEWGSYLGMYSAEMALLCGAPIGTAMIQQRAAHHALVKKKCTLIAQYCASWLECSQVLAGIVPVPTIMPSFDLPLIQFAACGARALMLTVLRRPREAQAVLELAVAGKAANASLPSNVPFEFYSALAKLTVMAMDYETKRSEEQGTEDDLRDGARAPPNDAASPVDRAAAAERLSAWTDRLAGIDAHIGLLRIWRGVAPHTFESKLLLVTAERHRLLIFSPAAPRLARWDLVGPAMTLYERSASLAVIREYPLEAALALECAARFQDQLVGSTHAPSGGKYWRNAMRLYGEAGAEAKVKQMQEEEKAAAVKVPAWGGTVGGFAAASARDPLSESSIPSATSFLVRPPFPESSRDRDGWTSSGSSASSSSSGTRALRPHTNTLFELTHEEDEQEDDHTVGASGASDSAAAVERNSMGSTKWALQSTAHARSSSMWPLTPDAARSVIAGSASSTAGSISSGSISHSLVPVSSSAVATTTSTLLATLSVLKATASFFYETDESTLLQKLMSIVLETAGASSGVLIMQDAEDEQWRVELAASVDAQDVAHGIDPGLGANVWSQSRQPLNLHSEQRNFKQTPDDVTELSDTAISSASSVVSSASSSSSLPPLPLSVLQFVISSAESVSLSSPGVDPLSVWSSDPFFHRGGGAVLPKAMLALPVLKGGVVSGVLLLFNHYRVDAFLDASVQLLQLLCTHAVLSIDNRRLYSQLSTQNRTLEQQVLDRTRDLQVAKERAEKATAVKADFLSAMSHEIRTPLNAVLGMARLLADSPLSLEQRQYVSAIDTSSLLLLTIINDILDFSKIESAAGLKLHRKPQNMLEVAEAAFVLCGTAAATKGLIAAITVQPDIPPLLMVDATRLQQVLLNLLSNAVKFTAAGSVQLTVRIVEHQPDDASSSADPTASPTSSPTSVWLRFSVVDTGIGIKPEYVSQLGVSFVQLNPSSEYSGTGLGLVISKRLINAMGGSDIAVHSVFGKGSEFSCEIPFEIVREKSKSHSDMHSPGHTTASPTDDAGSHRTLHGLLPSQVSVLKSTHVVALWSNNIATDSWLLMLRYYLASVTVFANVSGFAGALVAEGSGAKSSAAASQSTRLRLRDALVVCDLDAPGVSEEDLQLAWHKACGVGAVLRLTALYSKQYDTERMIEATTGETSGEGDAVGTPGASGQSQSSSSPPHRRVSSADPSLSVPLPHRQLLRKPFRQAALLQALLHAQEKSTDGQTSACSAASSAVSSTVDSGYGFPDRGATRSGLSGHSSTVAASMSLPSVARRRIVSISAAYPLRVLLCEDNLLNQKMMVMTMRRLGYELVVCSNGQQALDALEAEAKKGRNSEIQAILMDVSMDVMSGLECTRIIRAQQLPNRCRPYIIAQTANVTDQAREACITAGMDDFLPKPINVEELVHCLKHAHAQAQGGTDAAEPKQREN